VGESLPAMIAPMLATAGELPASDDGWSFEVKWDGVRSIAFLEAGRLRLMSRRGNDVTVTYPELGPLAAAAGGRPIVLDGEIVALDEDGKPSFNRLQARINVADGHQAARLAERAPATLMIFDVLHLDGGSAMPLPWSERRELLESLELVGPSWRTPPVFPGEGRALLAAAREQGLEGVVAKLTTSPYRPGRRSEAWRKVKAVRTIDVVIGGFTTGDRSRAASFGALLVGVPDPQGLLTYVGRVGSGFDQRALDDIVGRLLPLRREASPFGASLKPAEAAVAVFVEPTLVGEVRYLEWTRERRLRAPVWRGLRPDMEPSDVEAPPSPP
jgi:bifunctional non-homologous end joining protein LigD